jgi:hypothetical protein
MNKVPPVLAEVEALRLDRAWLALENAQLKIAVVQGQAQAARQVLDRLSHAAHREGYQLRRLDDGSWSYTPLEAGGR